MQDKREKLINMAREGLDSDFIQMMEEKDKERREEFQRLYGDKTIREQSQISAKQLFDAVYEPFKKRYLLPTMPNIGNFLDSFYRELELVLFSAKAVSICGLECDTIELKYENLELETIREFKIKLNISLSNAISIIEGVTIGMYKPDPYEPPSRNSNLTSMDNFTNKMAYDFKYRENPLFVAKTNIDIYREIINKLERDEKVLFDESKNKNSITQPSDQAEETKNIKSKSKPYSAKVILEVIEKINETENILPKNLSGKIKFERYSEVVKSILGNDYDYSAGTLQNNYNKELNEEEQNNVFQILKKYGYDDIANQYRLKDRVRRK